MEDMERAMKVKQETEVLVSSFTKPSMQKTGRELLNVMYAGLALWQGDYETFRRMLAELTQKQQMEGSDYGDSRVKI